MKKTMYLLAVIATLIAGCSGGSSSSNSGSVSENLPNADFSFSDLRLNLSSINQVGVYKNPSGALGRKQSSVIHSTTQNDSYLVGYNAQGEAVPLVYLNSQNEPVQVPFNVFSFEVIGDFSYIVYYNSSDLFDALGVLESTLYYEYGPLGNGYKHLGMTQFEILLKSFAYNFDGYKGLFAYIITHNNSGKLFDALNALDVKTYDDGNSVFQYDLQHLALTEDKIIYFKKTNPRTNTCKGELLFDELNDTLTKTEVCTSIDFKPIYAHKTGYFVYTLNDKIFYSSPDFLVTGDLTSYFESSIPEYNTLFKSVGETIVMLSGKSTSSFVLFNGDFSIIEEKTEVLSGGGNLINSIWLLNKDGYDYFILSGFFSLILYVNFDTLDFDYIFSSLNDFPTLNQLSNQYRYVVYEGNMYQLGTFIRVLSVDKTLTNIDNNVLTVSDDFVLMSRTGYLTYTQAQGLAQINKSLNLLTGEIYLQSESPPTITITQIQPIN
jgi:hypothetical protein